MLFAGVVAIAGFVMIKQFELDHKGASQRYSAFVWRRVVGGRRFSVNLAMALPISFLAGLVSGMVGVGGGVLKVPMMVLLFGIPMDIAIGSSAFMIGVTATGGFSGHLARGVQSALIAHTVGGSCG